MLLSRAGLQSVQMKKLWMPLGKWAGRAGEMMAIDLHAVFHGFKGFYTAQLGVPAQQFDDIVEMLPQEWEHYHTSYEFYLTLGQKPETRTVPYTKERATKPSPGGTTHAETQIFAHDFAYHTTRVWPS
jgi:hypothetical protein